MRDRSTINHLKKHRLLLSSLPLLRNDPPDVKKPFGFVLSVQLLR